MDKESLLALLKAAKNDCESQLDGIESGNGSNWDINDSDNWLSLTETLDEAIRYISKN